MPKVATRIAAIQTSSGRPLRKGSGSFASFKRHQGAYYGNPEVCCVNILGNMLRLNKLIGDFST